MDLTDTYVADFLDSDGDLEIQIGYEYAFLNIGEVTRLRDHLNKVIEAGPAAPCRAENPSGPDCGCGFGKCDKGLVY